MARLRLVSFGVVVLAALVAPTQLLAQESGGVPDDPSPDPALLGKPADPAPNPAVAPQPGVGDEPTPPSVDPAAVTATTPAEPTAKASADAAATKSVNIKDFDFAPATITIDAGDTVNWTNQGPAPHSATADDGSFDTGVFDAGVSRSHTFDAPGTFPYHCTPHPFMTASVKVLASTSSGGGGSGSAGGGSDSKGNATPDTSASTGPSEAAATAAPDAAGSSEQLPSTGARPFDLAIAGALLLGVGVACRRLSRRVQRPA